MRPEPTANCSEPKCSETLAGLWGGPTAVASPAGWMHRVLALTNVHSTPKLSHASYMLKGFDGFLKVAFRVLPSK